jgi:hypothetical protein
LHGERHTNLADSIEWRKRYLWRYRHAMDRIMNEGKKRGAKTESLSLRIDPKTKFVLEFIVRVTGLRITDVIEKAIREYASATKVGENSYDNSAKNWLHYWHPEEGMRTINLLMDEDVPTSFEEDELRAFLKQHPEFFFRDKTNFTGLQEAFITVLWPKIEEYLEHWRHHKAVDRWATGALMLKAIKDADMRGPDWPRVIKSVQPAPKKEPSFERNEMDDEIPF